MATKVKGVFDSICCYFFLHFCKIKTRFLWKFWDYAILFSM